jgi:hypothetical protein
MNKCFASHPFKWCRKAGKSTSAPTTTVGACVCSASLSLNIPFYFAGSLPCHLPAAVLHRMPGLISDCICWADLRVASYMGPIGQLSCAAYSNGKQ